MSFISSFQELNLPLVVMRSCISITKNFNNNNDDDDDRAPSSGR